MNDSTIDKTMSRSFSALKLGAILMVFTGHFLGDRYPLLWVPTTVALLVFSYSSGFFTELKHGGRFDGKGFLLNKLIRLGIGLAVIEAALLILFFVQGQPGIWSWQTVVNLVGMNGLLSWFHIPNPSPYGKGMWFLTLLILFYLAYPGIRRIPRRLLMLFFGVYLILCFFLDRHLNVGVALWLTSCGFIAGVLAGKWDFRLRPWPSRSLCAAALGPMICLNVLWDFTILNFFLIFVFSIFFIFSVQTFTISDRLFAAVGFFSGCVLEIYLLHPYLTVRPTGDVFLDYLLSLILLLVVAKYVNRISIYLQKMANEHRHDFINK